MIVRSILWRVFIPLPHRHSSGTWFASLVFIVNQERKTPAFLRVFCSHIRSFFLGMFLTFPRYWKAVISVQNPLLLPPHPPFFFFSFSQWNAHSGCGQLAAASAAAPCRSRLLLGFILSWVWSVKLAPLLHAPAAFERFVLISQNIRSSFLPSSQLVFIIYQKKK